MAFHYDAGTLSSGLKLVEVNDSWDGLCGLFDLVLDVVRKRHVQQFLDGGNRHLHGHHEYEHADHATGDRVQDDELVTKEYGAGDSEQRSDGRECVGTVMPGVGDHHRAVQRFALDDGVAVKNLFHHNRRDGRPEGDHSRGSDLASIKDQTDLADSSGHQVGGHYDEHQADDQGGECLELAVSIVVVLVPALGGDLDEDDHYDVAQKV